MNDKLISSDEGNFDKMNVEFISGFKENKCPIDFKKNKEYVKLGIGVGSRKEGFEKCTENDVNDFDLISLLIGFLFSFTFYMLLIAYLIDEEDKTTLLVYLILIYIFGSLVQTLIVPTPIFYKTKADLDKQMETLLNLGVKVYLNLKSKKVKTIYPGSYTTDITGILNIPKKINYVKLKGLIIYGDKDYTNFKKEFNDTYKQSYNTKYSFKLISEGKEIIFPKNEIFSLNTISGAYSITCLHRLACLFLFQWFEACYESFSQKKKCIDIYFVKLISTEKKDIPSTKITVHETTYQSLSNKYLYLNDEENEKFKNDLEQHKQNLADKAEKKRIEQEKKEKREKEIEDNTEELSKFTSNNYKMRIYRYYQKVYMDLRCHEEKKNSYKKERIFLGEYDSNIEEDTIDEDDQTTYCPNGCDIQIVVKNYAYGYTIKVGTKFTKDFNYYSK